MRRENAITRFQGLEFSRTPNQTFGWVRPINAYNPTKRTPGYAVDDPTGSQLLEYTEKSAGEVAVIRAALGGAEVVSWQPLESGAVRVVLKSQSQADVDGCLDRLRKHNVSITGLWRVRRSLEDAFLAIVAEAVEE